MERFLALCLFLALLIGCVPAAARRETAQMEILLTLEIQRIANNSEQTVLNEHNNNFIRDITRLERNYQYQLARAASPEEGARITADYLIGLDATKRSYADQLRLNLRDPIALRFLATYALPKYFEMVRAEAEFGQRVFNEVMDEEMTRMIETALDAAIVAMQERERAKLEEISRRPIPEAPEEPEEEAPHEEHEEVKEEVPPATQPPATQPPATLPNTDLNVPPNTTTDGGIS